MKSDRRKVAAVSIVGTLVVLAATVSSGEHAVALDRGYLGTSSPDDSVIEEEFPPLLANYPVPQGGAHPFAAFRPPICEEVTYCDAHIFTATTPGNYSEIFEVTVTLEWPENTATGRNRLSLHLWPEGTDPTSGASLGPCSSPRDRETTSDEMPEGDPDYPCRSDADSYSFTMTEPSTTIPECNEPDPDVEADKEPEDQCTQSNENYFPFWITVVNAEGANLGYTLRLTFTELDLDFGEFDDPEREFQAQRTPPSPAQSGERPSLSDLFANPELVGDRDLDSIVIMIPGEDGELVEREFPLLAAGERAADTGSRVNPFVTAGIIIPLLGALAIFLVRRRRGEAGS